MSTKIQDFANDTLTQICLLPTGLLTATTTMATGVDMISGDGRCWMEVCIGTFNATSLSVQVSQSTATNSGFSDITGAVIAATTAQSQSVQKVSFDRDKQYLRLIATMAGTTIGISAVLGQQLKQL
jgi:hypothetical protein